MVYEGTCLDEAICDKVLERESSKRGFQIRQYRYAIPGKFVEEVIPKLGNLCPPVPNSTFGRVAASLSLLTKMF
jgi:hypothetical protein